LVLRGTVDQLNALLSNKSGGLSYLTTSDNPATAERLTLTVNDGGAAGVGGSLSATQSYLINITPVNDAPVLRLSAESANTSGLFASAQGALTVAPGLTVSDLDSSFYTGFEVRITSAQSGDLLSLTAAARQSLTSAGLTLNQSEFGVLSVSAAPGSVGISSADLQAILRGITFSTSGFEVGDSRTITYTVTDRDAVTGVNAQPASSAAVSSTVFLAKEPFAKISSITGGTKLTFEGDPKSALITVDMTTFRILSNGSTLTPLTDAGKATNIFNTSDRTRGI
jgi:hypothetical protein